MAFTQAKAVSMAAVMLLWAVPAQAAPDDWRLAPLSAPMGDAEFTLGVLAQGALIAPRQPGVRGTDATGEFVFTPSLTRDYDSGISLSLNGMVAVRDGLSRGRYENKNLDFLYGELRFGLGRIRLGMIDGPSALAVSGPKANADLALDDPEITLFRDPAGHPVSELFALRSSARASSNYAKLAYASPEVFGLQLALSFTPTQSINVLPFLGAGPKVPGRQVDIWEGALRYSDTFGVTDFSAYAGGALGRAEHKLPGQVGVVDLAAGLRADYPVTDDLTLSIGGAYRLSNARAFDINQAWRGGDTSSVQLSTGATYDAWSLSLEYGDGVAGAVAALPRLNVHGDEAAISYALNSGMALTGGWQRLVYGRGSGVFYNGAPRLAMDAGFLSLSVKTSGE